MEQSIWLFFGVVSVIITLGIIGKVVSLHYSQSSKEIVIDSMKKIEVECNFVCNTLKGNIHSVNVKFPSGFSVYSKGNNICGLYENRLQCVPCGCNIEEYSLSLNTSLAEKFGILGYDCYFERLSNSVGMSCK